MLQNDGVIIRGLGFVSLYSAYLEEEIDNLLTMLHPIEEYGEDKQRWFISRKIKHVKKIINRINFEGRDDLIQNLDICKKLFEDRNKIVHGRIYANFDRPDSLKSGRANIPDRNIDSGELYQLANEFDDFRSAIYRPMVIKVPRAINEYLNETA
jgi:hypothetical protein